MEAIFGLDFGTTNSALSVNNGGEVEVIDIDSRNILGKTLRSVIYFDDENNIFTGQEAIENYIENGAMGRFMQSIKSFLPDSNFDHTYVMGKKYHLEDLIAIMLRRAKEEGEKYIGIEVDSVVIGRPAVFSEDAKKDKLAEERLVIAAKKVGFKNISFQLEPIAAAVAFEKSLKVGEEKKVLIGDFGGGTSDFTIIRLHGDESKRFANRKEDILAIGGVYIGGDTFDSQIMWEKVAHHFGKNITYENMGKTLRMPMSIVSKLRRWHLIPQLRERSTREFIRHMKHTGDDVNAITNLENLIEDNYGFMLFQSIEKAKIDLSSYENSRIVFRERNLSISEMLLRAEFETIIADDIYKIRGCIKDVLLKANLSADDIDIVFTTGGSSHIPCIKNIFIEEFSEGKMRQMDAFTSVAYGLGVSASMQFD